MNNWYVLTGGPSTGKSTVLHALSKAGFKTFEEAARLYIDAELAKGRTLLQIRASEKKFQETILDIKISTEQTHNESQLTIFERGIHDTLAYYQYYDWNIPKTLETAVAHAKYKKVFLLEPLKEFTKDYARTEDKDFTEELDALLMRAYQDHRIEVIRIPLVPIKERVKLILRHIE